MILNPKSSWPGVVLVRSRGASKKYTWDHWVDISGRQNPA